MHRFILVFSVFISIMFLNPKKILCESTRFSKDNNVEVILEQDNPEHTVLSILINDIEVKHEVIDGEVYQRIFLGALETLQIEGLPELPKITKYILLPPDSDFNFKIINENHKLVENMNLMSFESSEQSRINLQKNDLILSQDGFFPHQPVFIGSAVIFRGHRIAPVVIYPIRVNPETGETLISENIELEIDYSGIGENRLVNPGKFKSSITAQRLLDSVVLNPSNPPGRDSGDINGSVLYLIGDWDNVEEALEPLIEWRRRMGWTTEVLRVNNQSTDDIKDEIQTAYDEWETPPEAVVLCGDTDGDFPMAFWDTRDGVNWPYESDHLYGLLEGDDVIPEVSVGRLIFTSIDMLEGIVNKIVNYESDPYLGEEADAGWQLRAALIASDNQSGRSTIDVSQWSKNLLQENGYEDIEELYWTNENPRPSAQQFIIDNVNNGINFLTYRGFVYMNGFRFDDVDRLRNDRMLPFVILATCNTGDYGEHNSSQFYYTERFLYHPDGGAIGAVGAAGYTNTQANNLIISGILRGIFDEKIVTQGWALMAGKLQLYNNYFDLGDVNNPGNRNVENWLASTYIYNLMGDPATALFTGIPQELSVAHPEFLSVGESQIEVRVTNPDEEPVNEAQVCLYKSDEFQLVTFTDAEGIVEIALNPEFLDEGEVMLTVTGHNLKPYLVDLEIRQIEDDLGVGGVEILDEDETANPGDEFDLRVEIANYGETHPEGPLNITLSEDSNELEVIAGEVGIEEVPEPGGITAVEFTVQIGPSFENEKLAVFDLEISNEEQTWESLVSFSVSAPELQVFSISWEDDFPLASGNEANLLINLKNTGSMDCAAGFGTLFSLSPLVAVLSEEADFEMMGNDEIVQSRPSFGVGAEIFQLPGTTAYAGLIYEAEDGYIDTVYFEIPIAPAEDGQPFGGDKYGYTCYDNTDEEWQFAPEFNWIEINPDLGGEGINTEMSDRIEEGDESILMDLPFTFTYYGQDFNEITICTNGWIAMGDQSNLVTARNRRIPGGMIASGMICPFWDDLLTRPDESGVYTFHDEEVNIFIIEWSDMRRLGPAGNAEATETFQVILKDPEFHPTISGDGDIVFQYLDVEDARSCFTSWDTPFATVGIASPDRLDGLEYSYWNQLHPGAAPLVDESAILFTTFFVRAVGALHGLVSDSDTEAPIPNARVQTSFFQSATADENGEWIMQNVFALQPFELTASAQGYNPLTIECEALEEDGDDEYNFALDHPEFLLSSEEIAEQIEDNSPIDIDIEISNRGNGFLNWSATKQITGLEPVDNWQLREQFPISEITEDSRISGAIYNDGLFYISGGNDRQPVIYVMNRDGEIVNEFRQPIDDDYRGFRDIAFDGELLWGSYHEFVWGMDIEGNVIYEWECMHNYNSSMAWDSDSEQLWISHVTTNPIAYTREGVLVENSEIRRKGLRIYGLAYYPEDLDGYNLYSISKDQDTGKQFLFKHNTADSDTILVTELDPPGEGTPLGIFITDEMDIYSWVMLSISNVSDADGGDRLNIWQMTLKNQWLELNEYSGNLDPDGNQAITLTLDPEGLEDAVYEGEFHFEHNAGDGLTILPVTLTVGEVEVNPETDLNVIRDFELTPAFPNPFNSMTRFSYALPKISDVSLRVYDVSGRLVNTLVDQKQSTGQYNVVWDGTEAAAGVYLVQIEAAEFSAVQKVVLVK